MADGHSCIVVAALLLAPLALLLAASRTRQNAELRRKLKWLMSVPMVDPAPHGISQDVLQKALDLCWEYARNGIEGVRRGHIVAVGLSQQLRARGVVRGINFMERTWVSIFENSYDVMMEMNFDGTHIVDGFTGQVTAHKFFASMVADNAGTGGASTAAAMALSKVPNTVVFQVSRDGDVKEFRHGALHAVHG